MKTNQGSVHHALAAVISEKNFAVSQSQANFQGTFQTEHV